MSNRDTEPRPGTEGGARARGARTPGLVRVFAEPGVDSPRSLPLGHGELIAGRDSGAGLRIDGGDVSRRHAVLRARADCWTVEDVASRNGTFVSARRARGEVELPPGALLRMGPVVYLSVGDVAPFADAALTDLSGALAGGPAMAEMRRFVSRFAHSDLAVLVSGETGAGKEVVARALHAASPRAAGPFVAVNCNELVANLAESILFGHRRGAFTGATGDQPGRFRAADGGTLLLDEVGDLPKELQGKLLRAIELREVVPVGAARPVTVDVRVVSATHRDLRAMVARGEFREDLFHRLGGVAVWLPPLRARVEDVPLLAALFLERDRVGGAALLTAEIVEALCLFGWPGNVRQLQTTVLAAAAAARIDGAPRLSRAQHLDGEVRAHQAALAGGVGPSDPVRLRRILDAMARHAGNVTRVADELGLHRAQVYAALKEAKRTPEEFRGHAD